MNAIWRLLDAINDHCPIDKICAGPTVSTDIEEAYLKIMTRIQAAKRRIRLKLPLSNFARKIMFNINLRLALRSSLVLLACPCILAQDPAHAQSQFPAGSCRIKVYKYMAENSIQYHGTENGTSSSSYTGLNIQPIAYIQNTGTLPVKIKLYSENPPWGSNANNNGYWYPSIPAGGRNPFVSGFNEPYSSRVALRGIKCDSSVNEASAFIDPVVGNPSLLERNLKPSESQIASSVFRSSIDLSRVRISNQIGANNRAWATSIPFGNQTIHVGPTWYSSGVPPYTLVHELVHVWQYQRGVQVGLLSVASGMTYAYNLGPPGAPYKSWDSFNVEQQGDMVADWYQQGMNTANKLFPYIRDCVRTGRIFCTPSGTIP